MQSYINKSSLTRHDFHNKAGIISETEFLLLLGYIISYNIASFPVTNILICYQNMVLKIYSRILFYIKIICFQTSSQWIYKCLKNDLIIISIM